jgi:hypothetical protein
MSRFACIVLIVIAYVGYQVHVGKPQSPAVAVQPPAPVPVVTAVSAPLKAVLPLQDPSDPDRAHYSMDDADKSAQAHLGK